MPELEVFYNTTTKRVRGWNADPKQQGNFVPEADEAVVILPIDIPNFESGEYKVDEANQIIVDGNPSYKPPAPRSGHPAQLVSITPTAARPARVKRIWQGREYLYDCLVTESVLDQYQQGNITIGDYLWVEYLREDEDIGGGEQIVIAKVRKTW